MGSEAIIHKIEEKARLAVEEIHLEGSRKVGEAKAKILAAAQENAKKIKDRVEDEKLDITRREQRKASMQIRQNTLGAKRRVIDRAFESATEKLCELEGEEWEALMTRLVIRECMPGNVLLHVNKRDMERLGGDAGNLIEKLKNGPGLLQVWSKALTEKHGVPCSLSLSKQPESFCGGILFEGQDYDVDASFEMLLRDVRERHEFEIAGILFGVGDETDAKN